MKPEEFPSRLRELLDSHNMTQARLAELTGIETTAINHFCMGRRLPSYENLLKIADAFGDSESRAYLIGT
jgi:transcriptional regulator with XRE-family HTH domain